MTLKVYTRGTLGHAPVNGKYYFVHRESRLVRSADMHTLPPTEGWEQVSLAQWEAFRKETKKLSYAEQLKCYRSYKCSSTMKSESPKSSSSKATSTKQPVKKSSPKPEASCSPTTTKSRPKSSSRSVKSAPKPQVKSGTSPKSSPTKRPKKPSGSQ